MRWDQAAPYVLVAGCCLCAVGLLAGVMAVAYVGVAAFFVTVLAIQW